MTGPRVRAELRLYDLPCLGKDSRLVFTSQYEYDQLRGSVGTGLVNVRVPLGSGGANTGYRLRGLDRRMVAPIMRDVDIITNARAFGAAEGAKIAHTGQVISQALVIDANDANDDIVTAVPAAGADSVVIADGSAGPFNIASAVVLQTGQVVMGGGSQLAVIGCNSGAPAIFTGPGTRPLVNGTNVAADVFQMFLNSTLQGIDITGGDDGIFGNNVSGFRIVDNNISGSDQSGIHLDGTVSGDLLGNTVSGTANRGIDANIFSGGTIIGNTSTGNAFDGFSIRDFNAGQILSNTATGNFSDGFEIGSLDNGVFACGWACGFLNGNVATDNTEFGFRVNNRTGGTAMGNTAVGNGDDTLPAP